MRVFHSHPCTWGSRQTDGVRWTLWLKPCGFSALRRFWGHCTWGNEDGSSERGPLMGQGSWHKRGNLCFPMRVAQHWAQVAQGGCGICSRGDVETQLGTALRTLLGCPCAGRVGADAPQPSTSASLLPWRLAGHKLRKLPRRLQYY